MLFFTHHGGHKDATAHVTYIAEHVIAENWRTIIDILQQPKDAINIPPISNQARAAKLIKKGLISKAYRALKSLPQALCDDATIRKLQDDLHPALITNPLCTVDQ